MRLSHARQWRRRARFAPARLAAVADFLDGLDHVARDGDRIHLEVGGVGHLDVRPRDALDGRIQVVESLALVDARAQLGADATRRPALRSRQKGCVGRVGWRVGRDA